MSGVKTAAGAVAVRYNVRVEVAGAPQRRRRYSSSGREWQPQALSVDYEETASGWVVRSVKLMGRNVTKSGLGIGCSEMIYTTDLPKEEQWVRDAIRDYAPTGSLR